ncbi:hypothetical protein [Phaeodactylibacter sp.]|uniref:hypothetical protein n=1 Tax=Phaeodactylibacter sp. TaxID=1940289 RepID=UPI0025F30FA5|nr:hypothetical protein [Phaeodactylibacter sp.]MCI4650725.1 hypothetical protein [Phaeodactylibacter sp.]MCI5093067.1 hypothetical protein [Phaeodactylibacter sp.]
MRKSNIYNSTLTILLLFATTTLIGQQVEKTLVKSFNLGGLQTVSLNVEAPVEVVDWDQPFMRVQMHIELDRGSEALLKSLVRAGRYNLTADEAEGTYSIVAPNLGREIKIGGQPLNDRISFVIKKPRSVAFTPAQREEITEETASSL